MIYDNGGILPPFIRFVMMKRFFFVLLCLFITACSQVEPFIDARREAGQVEPIGSSRPNRPVVCYGLFGSEEDRQALAQSVCDEQGKEAVFQAREGFSCKLLTPVREIYTCKTKEEIKTGVFEMDEVEPLPESDVASISYVPKSL